MQKFVKDGKRKKSLCKNISFRVARKMVEAQSQAVSPSTNADVTDKYKNLVPKLLQLRPEDWPNFIKSIRPEQTNKNKTKFDTKQV